MLEALYIHIPFCKAKCNYCDFLSFTGCTVELQHRYIEALKKEALLKNQKLDLEVNLKSIFFGGGTPTCLSSGLLVHLLDFIQANFPVEQGAEISVEANPGTVNKEKLQLLYEAGVNRLSFGVQTFNKEMLKILGRIHTPEDIYASYALAREVGFTNVNFDLMYGLPGQDLKDWERTLLKALEFNLEHISAYQLKIERGTPFGQQMEEGVLQEFDDELALDMYKLADDYLGNKGFIHYEVANFAKPGYKCRHNEIYWRTKPYLGLGPGAHSFFPPQRIENLGELSSYINMLEEGDSPPCISEELTIPSLMSETMFMGLRLLEGVNLEDFYSRFGQDARSVFSGAIKKCLSNGLVEINNGYIKLTHLGLYLGNIVFEEFLSDN
ncbi:MAG: hypothetical protein JM58_18890 [Peptococcaceae bacterium BICA1-8]|nr:MAG: hypothetical protein JM58_18890 [Peptococcaceae bacterium BICA1-8]